MKNRAAPPDSGPDCREGFAEEAALFLTRPPNRTLIPILNHHFKALRAGRNTKWFDRLAVMSHVEGQL